MDVNREVISAFYKKTDNCIASEQWAGAKPQSWAEYVANYSHTLIDPFDLPDKQLSRSELRSLCNVDSGLSDEACLASIMAWGGQNRKHGVTLFNRFDEVSPILRGLRQGQLDRLSAYQHFHQIWSKSKPLGMGAAYFTKIIFFCGREPNGYIMDQWTSKSINLILGYDLVHLYNGFVTKKNTVDSYKLFCEAVESIANDMGVTGEAVELAMFSHGGRSKHPWRQYVVDNYGS